MERSIGTGNRRLVRESGFTLLELMIVVAIIGVLGTLAVPSYQTTVRKAKEAVLRQDLFTLRDLLDQHRADQGKYPPTLQALVMAGYLRAIPVDPMTNSATTWQELAEPAEGGIYDVFSGSDLVGTNDVPYNKW